MENLLNNSFIIFEGPPASGKTFLTNRISQKFDYEKVLEPSNKMTSWFYKSISDRAFLTQMYFLFHRKLNSERIVKMMLEGKSVVQDYAFLKDLVYAKHFLDNKEFIIYKKYYTAFKKFEPLPSSFVYLDCDEKTLMKRIKKRNRKGEEKLSLADIKSISKKTYSLSRKEYPNMIVVDTSEFKIDISKNERDRLVNFISSKILNLC
jgi:deoxyadenosine/deoxycytidine kinase